MLVVALGLASASADQARAQVATSDTPAPAADTTADPLPAPLQFYKGREIAPYMTFHGADWLVRKERQSEEDCNRLLKALKIQPGQTVCDMGCGNGFYTLRDGAAGGRAAGACWPWIFSPRCSACSTSR